MDRTRRLALTLGILLLVSCHDRRSPVHPDVPLLVPINFYRGYTVGRGDRTTGLQVSRDGSGKTFERAAWPELIAHSVSVDDSGRYVYLSCGNGVMVSRDAARTWRLTGGWEMAEALRVEIDRHDPKRAWAATANGVFATDDIDERGRSPWRKLEHEEQFRYCSDVVQDPKDAETLWVATPRGLFVTRDAGRTFEATGATGPVRRLVVTAEKRSRILLATDGEGLQLSIDGGKTFERVAGTPDVLFSVVEGRKGIYCGGMGGMLVGSEDAGEWKQCGEGLPEGYLVYGIAEDPAEVGRVVVSGNKGLFEWRAATGAFTPLGFENALVPDVAFARLGEPGSPAAEPEDNLVQMRNPRGEEWRPVKDEAFAARKTALLDHFRGLPPPAEGKWEGWARATIRVRSGAVTEEFWERVHAELAEPKHSMFFSLPLTGFFQHARDELPEIVEARIREILTESPVYRGDTENHWVMHYAALLLAAQTFPETPAADWYTGLTTQENYDEARGWLFHWARLAAASGQGEFDSPNYLFMYVTPMLLLYDFAEEPAVKQLAGMTLDLLLADYFVESLQGAWCGGHSRIIGEEVERTRTNKVTPLHWLYAGGIEKPERIHGWLAFAGLSGYRAPAVLAGVANDRDEPFVHRERKRVRNVIRFGKELNPPVYKTNYMTPTYCLGSLQGGILQPIQQHTWDVTWLGSAENATLFTVHPSVSARELAMFFPEEIHGLTATVTAQKGSYADPKKLVSASAYEKVLQRENVLLALYQVPEDEKFPHVTLYWPECLERSDEGGWMFGRDGGFWLALRPTREPGESEGFHNSFRVRFPADRTGFVLVTRPATEETFEEFGKRIVEGAEVEMTGEGVALTLGYGDLRLTWGEKREFPEDDLFAGPFLSSKTGSRVIRITDGKTTRTLDFNRLTIEESR